MQSSALIGVTIWNYRRKQTKLRVNKKRSLDLFATNCNTISEEHHLCLGNEASKFQEISADQGKNSGIIIILFKQAVRGKFDTTD